MNRGPEGAKSCSWTTAPRDRRGVAPSSTVVASLLLAGLTVAATDSAPGVRLNNAQRAVPSAADLVQRILHTDPWGLGEAEVSARALVREQSGRVRELGFVARSRRYDRGLTKSLVRFTSPADLAGVGFLQIQKRDDDDDRWLYLPELKRSRRIAGRTRQSAFMGTDFSYADLDRRDLRDSTATLVGEETLDGHPCWRLDATPAAAEASYGRLEIWVRQDNELPIQWRMYARSGALAKTLRARDVRQVEGRWFITRSIMTNHAEGRETELSLDRIRPTTEIPDQDFTVRALEKP